METVRLVYNVIALIAVSPLALLILGAYRGAWVLLQWELALLAVVTVVAVLVVLFDKWRAARSAS